MLQWLLHSQTVKLSGSESWAPSERVTGGRKWFVFGDGTVSFVLSEAKSPQSGAGERRRGGDESPNRQRSALCVWGRHKRLMRRHPLYPLSYHFHLW